MTTTMLLLMLACEVGAPGPAPAGSPAAKEVANAASIASQAEALQQVAHELTSLVDESRRQVADGRSTPDAEIEKMRALMADIEERNTRIQADVAALEERARSAAGDPAPPVPVVKRR